MQTKTQALLTMKPKGNEKMKKILCLAFAALLMISLVSCGSFDYATADYSKYVKLVSPADVTRDMIEQDYNASKAELAQAYSQFNVLDSYSMDFKVTASIVSTDSEGNETKNKYSAWCFDTDENYVKSYSVGKDAAHRAFDNALIYDVTNAADFENAAYRGTEYNKAYTFNMDIPADYSNADVAGKTVAFTITPIAVYPSIYADAEIIFGVAESLNSVSGAVIENGDAVSLGDIVVIDYKGTLNGVAFSGGSYENYTMQLGYASFVKGFEEAIVGHKVGETFTIDVKFPENYGTADLAGKDTKFEITIHKGYRFSDEFVKNNTEFDNTWDYKNAMRLQYHSMYVGADLLCSKCEIVKYPSSLLSDYKYYYKTLAESRVNYYYTNYYQGQGYSLKQTEETLFPDGGIKLYAQKNGENLVLRDLVCAKILLDNGYELTSERFDGYLDYLATTLSNGDGVQYTREELIETYGESKLKVDAKAYYATQLIYENLTCLPFSIAFVMLY